MPAEPSLDAVALAKLAALARLPVAPDEAARLAGQMARIIAHVQTLAALPATGDDAPGGGGADAAADLPPLRPDVPHVCLGRERALSAAPERQGDGFGVPKIMA